MDNIFFQIRSEIKNFIYNNIEIVDGLYFNQYETIKRIHLYRNSQFQDKSKISGLEKIFANILNFRALLISKFLNIDTKHFKVFSEKPIPQVKLYLLEQELKNWLKKNNISRLLNQIAEELPIYGSVVLKKTKNSVKIVDLRRLFLDPAVENIQDSPFVIQVHYLTESQLKEKKDIWQNVDEVIFRHKNKISPPAYEDGGGVSQDEGRYIKIYERYGEVPLSWITGKEKDEDEMVKSLFIVSEAEKPLYSKEGRYIGEQGLVLFKSRWNKKYPYKDFHYSKIRGRWLGLGVFEELFPEQERINELANSKRVSMLLSSMHIFQRSQPSPLRNVLQQLENGDIITTGVGGELKPLINEERNIHAFQSEEQRWDLLADRISFVHEAIRGEALPATTPATNAMIMEKGASSVFAFKRENLAIGLREFFNEDIIPDLVQDISKEHLVYLIGDSGGLEKLYSEIADVLVQNYALDYLEKTGFYPENTEEIKQKVIQEIRKNARYIKIPQDFYKNISFEVDVVIDNEQVDLPVLAQNLPQVMQIIQNPDVLQNPAFKMLFEKYVSILGISPLEIELKLESQNKTEPLNQLSELKNVQQIKPDVIQKMGETINRQALVR